MEILGRESLGCGVGPINPLPASERTKSIQSRIPRVGCTTQATGAPVVELFREAEEVEASGRLEIQVGEIAMTSTPSLALKGPSSLLSLNIHPVSHKN